MDQSISKRTFEVPRIVTGTGCPGHAAARLSGQPEDHPVGGELEKRRHTESEVRHQPCQPNLRSRDVSGEFLARQRVHCRFDRAEVTGASAPEHKSKIKRAGGKRAVSETGGVAQGAEKPSGGVEPASADA